MRKILLSAAAFVAAMSVNAQEICSFNVDNALGLDSDNGTALTAGTVIGETTSIIATVGADDTYKPQSASFMVGNEIVAGGLQGATNPKDADGGTPATTLIQPAGGAFLVFEAKADGFLYVMHKASSNKAYTVFEEGTAISYTFAAIGSADSPLGAVYQFTLPYEVVNEQFAVQNPIEWAEREFLKNTDPDKYAANFTTADDGTQKWTDIKVNGLGVIAFPVYKDCKYIVNANGSKITAAGFAFSTADNLVIKSSDDVVIYKGSSIAGEIWTVAGVKPLCNNSWDPADVSAEMQTTDGVIYTYTKKDIVLEKGTNYEFKVVKGHAWGEEYPGQNFTFDVEETAKYKVTITFNSETKDIDIDIIKTGEAEAAEHIYSVIGTINGNWDVDTDMTKGADGLYAAVFEGVNAGDYKFKVRVDHDWSVAYPSSDYAFNVESDGSTVTITFNEESKEVKATVTTADGIQVVKALTNVAVIYNLAGQKVNNNYKGVVVINGKKMIQK
jgi:hypothetical protein